MFIKLDDVFREQVEVDFKVLLFKIKELVLLVIIKVKIVNQDFKFYIFFFLKGCDFDLIVIGIKGFSVLKEMIVGSIIVFLMDNIFILLVVVFDEYKFVGL